MRILIDMQGAQSPTSRFRGIGRYTRALAHEIAKIRSGKDLLLALNGCQPEAASAIREQFGSLVPPENYVVWDVSPAIAAASTTDEQCRQSMELIREAALANARPDFILVSSLFEGRVGASVTSIGRFDLTTPVAVIVYDLIPLIRIERYLPGQADRDWYFSKLDYLRRADLLLCISESSRRECLDYLGADPSTTINISAAADPEFRERRLSQAEETALRQRWNISGKFIAYTGGADPRKNISGLVSAYARLPKALQDEYQLAVICQLGPANQQDLRAQAAFEGVAEDRLVLTGYVSNEELVSFYNLCSLFVFPSWHEGFGLPALEAMNCGAAVIGANTSSVPEILSNKDALFDPLDVNSIKEKMQQALSDEEFRRSLAEFGKAKAREFTWEKTARRALDALETRAEQLERERPRRQRPRPRRRLAFVSPVPPARTGIADFAADILPPLSDYYDIEIITDAASVEDPWIEAHCRVRTVDWFRENAHQYERVVYQFGNSTFHEHMFSLIRDIPGVVVLHDFFLSGVVGVMDRSGAAPNLLAAEAYRTHGYAVMQERFGDVAAFQRMVDSFPCNRSVVDAAVGVVVHSGHAFEMAERHFGPAVRDNWRVVPLARAAISLPDRASARARLGIGSDEFVVASFGQIARTKMSSALLEGFSRSALAGDAKCRLVFVGDGSGDPETLEILTRSESRRFEANVHCTGWVEPQVYRDYLAAADMAVQMRTTSRGETSAAALDCLNAGLPLIVNASGSMAELPDDVAIKLPEKFDIVQFVEALEGLRNDPPRRQALSRAGRRYLGSTHAAAACAEKYASAIEEFYRHQATGRFRLRQVLAATAPTVPALRAALFSSSDLIFPEALARPRLIVDVTSVVKEWSRQWFRSEVAQSLKELLRHPPEDLLIEPVAINEKGNAYYARAFTLRLLGLPDGIIPHEPLRLAPGDRWLVLAPTDASVSIGLELFQRLQVRATRLRFLVPRFGRVPKKRIDLWRKAFATAEGVFTMTERAEAGLRRFVSAADDVGAMSMPIEEWSRGALDEWLSSSQPDPAREPS